MSTQDLRYIFSRWEKKKSHSPYGQVLPLLPKAGLFFSLESGSKLFSQPLQRATTGPWPLRTTEGVEHGGRGVYVTQHAQEASRWEKKLQCTGRGEKREEGEEEESETERCFQLLDKSPSFVKTTWKGKAQHKPAMCLKSLGAFPKGLSTLQKLLLKKSKTMQPTVNQGRWEPEHRCYPLLNCILLSNAPFALCLNGSQTSVGEENLSFWNCESSRLGSLSVEGSFKLHTDWSFTERRSHQCHYKHLPARPTSNAVPCHQPQPTQGT